MKKFLVLYKSTQAAAEKMAQATPEQAKAGMDAWMAWADKNKDMIVELGMPVTSAGALNKSGMVAGDRSVGGYSIVQGASFEEVKAKFEGHPHFMMEDSTVDFLEFLPMPGMSA